MGEGWEMEKALLSLSMPPVPQPWVPQKPWGTNPAPAWTDAGLWASFSLAVPAGKQPKGMKLLKAPLEAACPSCVPDMRQETFSHF